MRRRASAGGLQVERLEDRLTPGFVGDLNFAAGDNPQSIAAADFSGDGIPDLAVANEQGNNVSVLLGVGDGVFQPAQNFAAGINPYALAVGDFNGDGIPDLAVANYGSDTVSILLGNGDGTFQAAHTVGVEARPVSVMAGDVNGDGFLDLALAYDNSGVVTVLLGNGDGSFQPARDIAAMNGGLSMALRDVNNDGNLDLVVTFLPGGGHMPTTGGVRVLLGNGDGTFQPARDINIGSQFDLQSPRFVAVGDFNGDGLLDLAVIVESANGGQWTTRVLLGQGDGSFQQTDNLALAGRTSAMAVGDFNGDGIPDLAIVDSFSSDVSILLGRGDGSFEVPQLAATTGTGSNSIIAADFNGDGVLDLAIANGGGTEGVSVLLGQGNGSFRVTPTYFVNGAGSHGVAVGDFNGDGIPDLAIPMSNPDGTGAVSVLLGVGDGSFQPASTFAAGLDPTSVAVGDFNGDGILDLAVVNEGSDDVSVLLGNGDGTFQPAQTFAAGAYPESVVVADFNGDGIPDLAVANDIYQAGTVSILLGNGDGTFRSPASLATGSDSYSLTVGDFNGDGIQDLAVANAFSSDISVLLGNGDGSFQTAQNVVVQGEPLSVVVGDFNGDGIPDLAATNDVYLGGVSVLLGNGDGTFQEARTYSAGNSAWSVAVGDFNGDGIQDLAVANAGGNNVSVLLGNGDGSFRTAPISYIVGPTPFSLAVADLNGDGYPDLAVPSGRSGTVSILLNDGVWPSGPGLSTHGPSAVRPVRRPARSAKVPPPAADLVRGIAMGKSLASPESPPVQEPGSLTNPLLAEPTRATSLSPPAENERQHPTPPAWPLVAGGRADLPWFDPLFPGWDGTMLLHEFIW